MGIAALTLGIVGIVCCFLVILAPIGAIATLIGLILGIIDVVKKGKTKGKQGTGLVGLIICSITFIILLIESFLVIGIGYMVVNQSVETKNNIVDYPMLDQINQKQKDQISGNCFEGRHEKSLLMLNKNGTFKYYQNKNDLTNNYYEGTYRVYQGEDAVDYISNELEEYGVTEQEQRDLFERSTIYSVNNYYCLVLENDKCMVNGENTLSSTVVTPYFGFYFEDEEVLDLANMNSGTYVYFEKED